MKFTIYMLNGEEVIIEGFEALQAYLEDFKDDVDVIVPR